MSDRDIIDTIAGAADRWANDYAYTIADAVLAALRSAGYTIVEEGEYVPRTGTACSTSLIRSTRNLSSLAPLTILAGWPGDGWAVSRNVGKVLADRPKALDPDEARSFAAALLAAADAAEADQ